MPPPSPGPCDRTSDTDRGSPYVGDFRSFQSAGSISIPAAGSAGGVGGGVEGMAARIDDGGGNFPCCGGDELWFPPVPPPRERCSSAPEPSPVYRVFSTPPPPPLPLLGSRGGSLGFVRVCVTRSAGPTSSA